MEAPDKIYLTKNRIDVISQFFHSAPIIEDGFVNIEYIRKDALLEWAKEKDLSSVLHHPDRHYILVELIKKIESL